MNLSFQVNEMTLHALSLRLNTTLSDLKHQLQRAMAKRLLWCVHQNFGGAERFVTKPYPPLSEKYAERVGRSFATLYVTGALKNSVQIFEQGEEVSVGLDGSVPYDLVHQYGGGNNIPARPYFPLDENDDVLPEVQDLVMEAAQEELERMLSQ